MTITNFPVLKPYEYDFKSFCEGPYANLNLYEDSKDTLCIAQTNEGHYYPYVGIETNFPSDTTVKIRILTLNFFEKNVIHLASLPHPYEFLLKFKSILGTEKYGLKNQFNALISRVFNLQEGISFKTHLT
jgi:hypothetical protein